MEEWQETLAKLVETRIGIRLRTSALGSVIDTFVAERQQALHLSSPASYVELLRSEPTEGAEFSRLTGVCANGQTSFYRDLEQLQGIVRAAASTASQSARPVSIWCAGCSTGEEAYSLAILLEEAGVRAEIVGTDINADQIALARQGLFSAWKLRNVPIQTRNRYFVQDAENFCLTGARDSVTFARHNLLSGRVPEPAAGGAWDIILCRNVFIYYATTTIEQTIHRMVESLTPNGWIFIGASETLHGMDLPIHAERIGNRFAYRRGIEPSDEVPE